MACRVTQKHDSGAICVGIYYYSIVFGDEKIRHKSIISRSKILTKCMEVHFHYTEIENCIRVIKMNVFFLSDVLLVSIKIAIYSVYQYQSPGYYK